MAELSLARTLSPESVATLKKKASEHLAIDEVPVFSGGWQKNRERLPRWLKLLEEYPTVFSVTEVRGEDEEIMSSIMFRERLKNLRGIELETQMAIDLEEGFIEKHEQFTPRDLDWTDGTK